MVLTWPAIQYPINIAFILGIWTTNFVITPMEAELMGGHSFPKENLILTLYMINAWWLHLLDGLGHYFIHPGTVAQIMVMTNNITDLVYTYVKLVSRIPLTFSSKLHTSAD